VLGARHALVANHTPRAHLEFSARLYAPSSAVLVQCCVGGLLGSGTGRPVLRLPLSERRQRLDVMAGLVIGGSIGLGVGLVLAVGLVRLLSERL
jgi:hypothetical protein